VTVTSRGKAAAAGRTSSRTSFLSVCLGALALAFGLLSVPVLAQTSVTNIATVAPPDGVVDANPGNDSDDALVSVAPAAVDYDFCPAGTKSVYSVVNGVRISSYVPDAAGDAFVDALDFTVAGDLNGLMVDPVRNRLLFISRSGSNTILWAYDADNGGWYQAAAPFASPDFPRAAMGPDGIGYLIAGNNATPEVWRVTADPTPGSFAYTVQNIGTLTYDVAPTNNSSGDIAFDGNGIAWLSAGQDLYHIDFTAGLQAVRQARPLLNGSPSAINWAGIAFSEDGRLYVADNSASSSYYAYDPATNLLTQAAPTTAGGSRDLASCAFPVLAEPQVTVVKTLAQINGTPAAAGAAVAAGDTLTYAIAISNSGGAAATLFEGDVDETLPANTTAVATGSDFTCTGSNCPNTATVNVPAGGSVTLNFVVQVVDPLPSGVSSIDNVVAVKDVVCTAPGNDCMETNPLSATVIVAKTADPVPGTLVTVGQTITYTVTTTVTGGATSDVVALTDTPSAGLTFAGVTSAGAYTCNATLPLVCTLPAGTAAGTYPLQYTLTVNSSATTNVVNTVAPRGGDDPSCTTCTTQHPLQPSFGTCDATMYLAQNVPTGLFEFNTSSNPFIVNPIGPASSVQYNAIAMHPTDGYIYGLQGPDGTLVRIGSDGSVVNLGAISGLPVNSVSGEIGPDGTYYVAAGGSLYRINLATRTATSVVLSQNIGTLDMAWHNGLLYTAVDSSNLYAINPANGNVTTIGLTGTTGSFGGMFGATNGVFGSNNNGGFYRFDLTTGRGTLISGLQGSGSNDGAKCATTPLEFPIDLAITKDDGKATYVQGTNNIYSIVVSNLGPFGVSGATVSDPLPAGISTASWTCGNATGGGTCGVGSGTGGIANVPVNLPNGASVTFTLTMPIPADFSGDLVNAATVTSSPDSPDPNQANNSATDIDTAEPGVVTVGKTATPASGTSVEAGDTLTYTLTYTVAGGLSTDPQIATDQLGAGLTFGALGTISDPARLTCSGTSPLTCTLAAGAPAGTYTVQYTATVDATATGTVTNTVTGVPCTTPTGCTTTHNLSTVTVGKSASPASGTSVEIGDTLTYTLTYTVAGAASTEAKIASDQLGAGLTFGALGTISDPARLTCSGTSPLTCTLALGAPAGTYTVQYTATVDATATGTVTNTVSGVPCATPTGCTTTHNLSSVTVGKSANPTSGTSVEAGDTLTYTLTYTVTDGASTEDKTATDQLGAGLTFGAVGAISDPGRLSCSGTSPLTCTLAAGAPAGVYTVQYTATVDAGATGTVTNTVSGQPCTTPTGCTTTHTLSSVTVGKTATPASGTSVEAGDTLTYTLTYTVTDGASTEDKAATDQLGPGLTFGAIGAISDPGRLSCNGTSPLTCTLAAGAPAGTYTVQYTATVDATATGTVTNTVSGVPCTTAAGCTTTHTLSSVTVGKTANPPNGASVEVGDTLTYTLTYTVAGAASTEAKTASDQLGAGLTFGALGAISDPGRITCSGTSPLTCTLAPGAPVGTYTVQYTATVDATATGTVTNTVSGVPCSTAAGCTTTHTLSSVTVGKTANPPNGASVEVGDTLAYTLTYTVAGAASTEAKTASDQLGAGLTFGALGAISDPGRITCSGTSPLTCTLAPGAPMGTYTVQYTATVDATASGTVTNTVSGVPCTSPTGCTTTHNLSSVTVGKSANPASGTSVEAGDTLTYTLTYTVTGGASTEAKTATDQLGAGLTFGALGAISDPGRITCSGTSPLTCTLAPGAPVGTYTVQYTATVDAGATGSVTNTVTGVPCATANGCTTEHPLSSVTVGKTANPANGTSVEAGDTLTYTLTYTVAGATSTEAKTATDQLGAGLTFGAVGTISDPARLSCSGASPMTCTLAPGAPAGTYTVQYTATVDATATGTVTNTVSGVPCATAAGCTTDHSVSTVTVGKTANPANGTSVEAGDTLTYTLTYTVTGGDSTEAKTATDQLGAGLTFGAVGAISDPGRLSCSGTSPMTCTLAPGAPAGTYTVQYTATVDATATGTVTNTVSGVPCATANGCTTTHTLSTVTVGKSANPANGVSVEAGDTLTYTLTYTVTGGASTEAKVATDQLGAGLTFAGVGAISDPSVLSCTSSTPMTCTLAAGAAAGTYTVQYTATVDATATGTVTNTVSGVPCATAAGCITEHPLSSVTVGKTATPASGTSVEAGDTLTYTLTYTVTGAASSEAKTATDQLGAGLTFGEVEAISDPAQLSCSGISPLSCTLAAGAPAGTYTVRYTATVDATATGTVTNTVSGVPCASANGCVTTHELSSVTVGKSANPASGTPVEVGQALSYTLTYTVTGSASTEAKTVTDQLGPGLTFGELGAISDSARLSCSGTDPLSCTLAAGAPAGTYTVQYTATVDAAATGSVTNTVTGVPCTTGATCITEHPLRARVDVVKSANPAAGGEVHVGDTIEYTLTATVTNGTTTEPVRLIDTPGAGLTIGALPANCTPGSGEIYCTLPAGATPGVYTFVYSATVDASASGDVRNAVVSDYQGRAIDVSCLSCNTQHRVAEQPSLRIVKVASVREASIGDMVRYTLTVENVGNVNATDVDVLDTASAGFSYVEGSLSVTDGDNAATVSGHNPIRFEGVDVAAGESATLVYLMRIGAGVRPGTHINQAQAFSGTGTPISNVATAQVALVSDPLVDDSLILGTVFDDRDGDGWQDSAALTGVRVQGGFDPAAYLPNSTTIDRGTGPQPVPDASAPLLHGIDVGEIGGRQSQADPAARRQVVIRQRLTRADFTGDFVLTSRQGASLRMDAAGNMTAGSEGEAADGLNAAAPAVERRIAQGEGGYVVDYVIRNEGIDERGIPGVRIASVDGLLVETDQFGRYHLVDIPGGAWERGRNFILKVDPSTLPPGTQITTDNPLVRRITPGLPVRFDFGAKLPMEVIEGGERQVELELGEVVFAPGSAEVRERYLPAIEQIAAKIAGYDGGEVVIHANGESQALAFDRAAAVKAALLGKLSPETADALRVSVRTDVADPASMVAGIGQAGPLLGTVLFDTDRDTIRPEFAPLLDRIAAHLEQAQGGTVSIVGHADRRGADAYNLDLGMRRARAVYEALAERLAPEVRSSVRVETDSTTRSPTKTSDGPATPAGDGQ
jgi:uncharacterized repeat protein (TIGR01451 family)/fimbrial isopeptide formation D2 family protein